MFFKKTHVLGMGLCLGLYPIGAGAQISSQLQIVSSLLESVIIDVESNLDVSFGEAAGEVYIIDPQNNVKEGATPDTPATIRITGDPVEIMVNLERDQILSEAADGAAPVTISDFNLIESGSGSEVGIMPDANENSILLNIGGSVSGVLDVSKEYMGLNILNVNYL